MKEVGFKGKLKFRVGSEKLNQVPIPSLFTLATKTAPLLAQPLEIPSVAVNDNLQTTADLIFNPYLLEVSLKILTNNSGCVSTTRLKNAVVPVK